MEQDRRRRTLVAKHPRVSLVPNSPRDEHGEGGHRSSIGVSHVGPSIPPLHEGILKVPIGGVHVHKTKLVDDRSPEPNGEAALDQEVDARFLLTFVKRAKPTIIPTTPLQPVGGPVPVLQGQPCEEFNLRGGQALQTMW